MRNPFRRRNKKKSGDLAGSVDIPNEYRPEAALRPPLYPPTYRSAELVTALPHRVLERIFAYVCPHTQDRTYEPCEGSPIDDGCMLCDLRDISSCVKVCKAWRWSAVKVL